MGGEVRGCICTDNFLGRARVWIGGSLLYAVYPQVSLGEWVMGGLRGGSLDEVIRLAALVLRSGF
jgi:hypothetical protein